ncbi:unnamed protein product [Trichogramma brassicae]|uniref:Uncharacterized protein n=1 Tax=Trichogramma brassicae TaxID=86971 RepID=A0A6H5HWN8_9HYME|nr:unnamed protein product [Trichogramma brassicae]
MYGLCHHANENGQITFVREVTSETRSLEGETVRPNKFYSESQSDLCYSRGPGREHVAWVLVTLGKSAALLRKVQEMCSATELTSESAQRPGAPSYIARRGRRATAAAAAVVGSRCLSRGREVAPIPVRPRNGAIRRARRDLQGNERSRFASVELMSHSHKSKSLHKTNQIGQNAAIAIAPTTT